MIVMPVLVLGPVPPPARGSPGCGHGGVDQIWPSGIPARFSGHSSAGQHTAGQARVDSGLSEGTRHIYMQAGVSPLSKVDVGVDPCWLCWSLPRLGLAPAELGLM